LDYDIGSVLDAVNEGQDPERPTPGPTSYLVWRPEFTVEVQQISGEEGRLLGAMAGRNGESGCTFQIACHREIASQKIDEHHESEIVQRAIGYLLRWFDLGLIHGLRV
jgi:hypothetical protein